MTKTQSGLILIAVGVVMNVLGRLVPHGAGLPLAGLLAVWMIASVVFVLFGLFRLVSGLAKR